MFELNAQNIVIYSLIFLQYYLYIWVKSRSIGFCEVWFCIEYHLKYAFRKFFAFNKITHSSIVVSRSESYNLK